MDIKVIGAGLGGLLTACMLAKKGHKVTVLEKNSEAGGKIGEISACGFRFDTGPSLLTMPFILESFFAYCNANMDDYLEVKSLNPICKYFYQDGTQFDCHKETSVNIAQIHQFAPEDVQAYKDFLEYSANLYKRTKEAFLFNPLFDFSDLKSLTFPDFLKIDAFKTVSKRIDRQFSSSELRQFFKRFATYNGSSPYKAPATLNVIPHVELAMGGFYIIGGIYSLVTALLRLAKEWGVEIVHDADIEEINTIKKKVTGITSKDGDFLPADLIISNADANETYLHLLDSSDISFIKQKKMQNIEPSCSGFVLLLGIDEKYHQLEHHNIFFSDNYHQEFHQIFDQKVMPDDPTIYVVNTSATNPDHAPKNASNLFILVNAPYLSNQYDWKKQQKNYKKLVIRKLEERGLTDLSNHIIYSKQITPLDFYHKYRSNKGSIYGTSSNSKLSAFLRPRNKCRSVEGLYLVGGSTHPGGGIPLVTLSAFHAVELIERFENDS